MDEATPPAQLSVRCWGTRGSIPSPGPATTRYGGNTSCVAVRVGGRCFIFDAGTGIRPLGHQILDLSRTPDTPLFLTHFHWDHIQGLPFFVPLYTEGAVLKILGPRQPDADMREIFERQMAPIHFPVPFSMVAAQLDFGHMEHDEWEDGGVTVRSMQVRHPSTVLGYRIEAGGVSVCFIPDNELEGEGYDLGPDWRARLVEFVGGADLLIHDSMYTDSEYAERRGWGHSTFRQSVDLARDAGVRRLLFFHHDPQRSDDALDAIVDRTRDEAAARGVSLEMAAAAEGEEIHLHEGRP
ncbi:MAG: MBL fold metallo-hydrolase [Gemmatimonadota bacterium]|nr:MBL fold metallo-hydrolase [Gemmatimonadota bacterium]